MESSRKVDAARQWIAGQLQDSGLEELERRGKAMRDCGKLWLVAFRPARPADSRPVPVNHCRDRLCPGCARIRASKWAERARPLLEEVRKAGRRPKLLTLTQRSRPGESLARARRRFEASFRRLYLDTRWKHYVHGWIASREVTYTEGAWHYHAHLLIDADYWQQPRIRALWLEVTGDSFIVDIREAKDGSEREALKYALKVLTVPAELLPELAAAMRGARLVSTGGSWRGRVRDELLEPTDTPDAGCVLVSVAELLEWARDGSEPAAEALGACTSWIWQRAGARGLQWWALACRPRGSPERMPGSHELERLTGGAIQTKAGGWYRCS